MNTYKKRAGSQGFTLIEMMIVLVIGTILLAVAGPGFRGLMGNNRSIAEVYTLRATLNQARSEALARRAPVVVCPTRNGTSCAESDDWSTGYMAFVDTDNNNTPNQNDPDEEIVQLASGPLAVNLAFDNGNRRVRFGAQGVAVGFEGTFTFCDGRGATHARALIINPVGTLVAAVDTNDPQDNIVNAADDDNVACSP